MSQITILNQVEDEIVRIAIFKKPIVHPSLQTIAWQIVDPPPLGQCVVPVPADYTVFAKYSIEPESPQKTNYTTNVLTFSALTARFDIHSVDSQDRRASGAQIEQKFDDLVMNEVRVTNNYGMGVWGHIQKDGFDVYPAQVIGPGGVLLEDLRSGLYLAVVHSSTQRGERLIEEEISLTGTPIVEGATATVTGSMWKGYSIAVDEIPATKITGPEPREATAKTDSPEAPG